MDCSDLYYLPHRTSWSRGLLSFCIRGFPVSDVDLYVDGCPDSPYSLLLTSRIISGRYLKLFFGLHPTSFEYISLPFSVTHCEVLEQFLDEQKIQLVLSLIVYVVNMM
jgi:hypothetical protein